MKIKVEKCSCGLMQNSPSARHRLTGPEELTSILENELEQRQAKLEAALDRAIRSSPVIRSIIQEIHDRDCELVLVLTARAVSDKAPPRLALQKNRGTQLELTSGDRSFLRSLRISID